MRPRKLAPVAAGLTLMLAAAACTSDSGTTDTGAPAPKASGEALNLKGICPDTVVFQSNWFPEADYGYLYQLVGRGYTIDTKKKLIRGPLVGSGQDTGVKVEIRTGGPAIGFQQVSAQMYADKSITLGQVGVDEAIQNSAKQPTLAVLAPFEISPLMIMWNRDKHPEFNTIADIGQTDTKILYYGTDTYMQYLLGAGLVRPSQLDGSYDGTPTRWVASDGDIASAGYATSEPYIVKAELGAGKKSYPNVDLQLVNDTGYPTYETIAIRSGDKDKLAPCLKKLVPIMQQASVDFIAKPQATNDLVIKTVKTYKDFWTYSPGMADYAVTTLKNLGLVGNGPDRTLGNMQEARIRRMVDILTPIFAAQRKPVKEGLKPGDLYTNDFIDTAIGVKES
ncbi:MAG TPA: ABC transporter substrate-binding protein [Mycobacteriales bacterium]